MDGHLSFRLPCLVVVFSLKRHAREATGRADHALMISVPLIRIELCSPGHLETQLFFAGQIPFGLHRVIDDEDGTNETKIKVAINYIASSWLVFFAKNH